MTTRCFTARVDDHFLCCAACMDPKGHRGFRLTSRSYFVWSGARSRFGKFRPGRARVPLRVEARGALYFFFFFSSLGKYRGGARSSEARGSIGRGTRARRPLRRKLGRTFSRKCGGAVGMLPSREDAPLFSSSPPLRTPHFFFFFLLLFLW
ncbi:hypothetical protein FQA47_022264 [Oryzias melastigma]|uniref:Uncharacterized protein n=1 Tax=Oryzias melastigma TaxID=30732 RepID=A0A834FIX9_ORYME|nr:hypothetical protein FQA47_022264 [Oryzias melastigma]